MYTRIYSTLTIIYTQPVSCILQLIICIYRILTIIYIPLSSLSIYYAYHIRTIIYPHHPLLYSICIQPTSGLDSSTALALIDSIKEMAVKTNATVLLTIHQPSVRLFNLLDKVHFYVYLPLLLPPSH